MNSQGYIQLAKLVNDQFRISTKQTFSTDWEICLLISFYSHPRFSEGTSDLCLTVLRKSLRYCKEDSGVVRAKDQPSDHQVA